MNKPVKADDCRCFRCGEILRDLFRLRIAKTFIDKAEYGIKVENSFVMVLSHGKRLYRHKRACRKGGKHGDQT